MPGRNLEKKSIEKALTLFQEEETSFLIPLLSRCKRAATTKLRRLLFWLNGVEGPPQIPFPLKKGKNFMRLTPMLSSVYQYSCVDGTSQFGLPAQSSACREMALQNIDTNSFHTLKVDFATTPNAFTGISELLWSDLALRLQLHNETLMVPGQGW